MIYIKDASHPAMSSSFIRLIEVLYEVPFTGTTTRFHSNSEIGHILYSNKHRKIKVIST